MPFQIKYVETVEHTLEFEDGNVANTVFQELQGKVHPSNYQDAWKSNERQFESVQLFALELKRLAGYGD